VKLKVTKSNIKGNIWIPGSKSHTIRAVFIASFAKGRSVISNPLFSEDTYSAIKTCKAFGAQINIENNTIVVEGFDGKPSVPDDVIDVGNSGTTLRIAVLTAALVDGVTVFTGDHQIRKRPLKALIESINHLGATAYSTRENGLAPVVVIGKAKGGATSIDAVTSQYLSSLLLNTPMLEEDTKIEVTRLNEVPYVKMTMWWLDKLGIKYRHENMMNYYIEGKQSYSPINMTIPGDFSSATFFMVLAAISKGEVCLSNLDMSDTQGDKRVLSILSDMGAEIIHNKDTIVVKGKALKGIDVDMNDIPDALPALAVAGCFAEGETRLLNVMQARMKETDRIAVMCKELKKMGADIEELEDGLIIRKSILKGCDVEGHFDHRVVMSLAVAGMCCEGETLIDTAESVNITFPEFVDSAKESGGRLELIYE
jgi:3-phosphoshikimate 1-carboxyvinyltransferase